MKSPAPVLCVILGLFAAASCSGDSMTPPASPTAPAPAPAPAPPPQPEAPATARYQVTFDATWTAATHPNDFPPGPHFSPLVGATHSAAAVFWRPGLLATEGIRAMAERGQTSPLDQEIRAAIAAGGGQRLLAGDTISSPKSTSFEFEISRDFSLVTLVTMVAPSPDWFLGVSGLNLLENGEWVAERVVPLTPWDAGTDSGTTFLSPDAETRPRQPVAPIVGPPLGTGSQAAPLGSFTFRRLS